MNLTTQNLVATPLLAVTGGDHLASLGCMLA